MIITSKELEEGIIPCSIKLTVEEIIRSRPKYRDMVRCSYELLDEQGRVLQTDDRLYLMAEDMLEVKGAYTAIKIVQVDSISGVKIEE